MKFKVLTFFATLSVAVLLLLTGCRGNTATNNAASTTNANAVAVNKPTPLPVTTTSAASDATDKTKIEEALKKAGFADVTVDTSTTPATLRGTVAKGKTQDMMKVALQASGSGKPLKNETTEK